MKKLILSSIIALFAASSSFASAEAKDAKAMAGEVEKKVSCLLKRAPKKDTLKTVD